ncbi:MAG TPA: hypothetical protein ENN96_00660, partial [Candidatus Acetothermia bacterium]|nr:hypothetical protein [Candidatus Acetothermia bacterium]
MRTRGLLLVLLWVTVTTIAVQAGRSTGAQFLAGTLGGYAGGALGAFTVSRAFSAGATGWESLSRAILGAFVGLAGGTVV